MTTTNKFTARLKYEQDWPKWFLQLQLRAHEQNVWEYINPKAADVSLPTQSPPLEETIARSQTQVTGPGARQEYPDRFAEYFMAANEIDTRVLYAAQEIASAEGGSLQAVVRALPGQLALPKRNVMQSFFSSFKTKSSQKLDLLMQNTNLGASQKNEASAAGADSNSLQTTTSRRTYWNPRSILAPLKRTKANTESSLWKLPNELLLNIVERLELHDEFILGQTCKAFRTIVQKDWNAVFDRLSSAHKHIFLTGVAFVLPDHWVCFEIRERHVQLALKLARLKTVNQKYLNKIMSPFSHEYNSFISAKHVYFRAEPKIIRERFILYTKLDSVHEDGLTLENCDVQSLCPHMKFDSDDDAQKRRWYYGAENLGKDVRTALSQPGNEISGYCPRCPTDYAIITGPESINIQAWYDFGSYKSPNDKSWTVHIWSDQNMLERGPIVHHDPGSIRRLYDTGTGENGQ
ncbi:f-box domain containing protein [Colletotrichum camelliae]|nr:f-box domain containing protein [Colletotrichum camelliae]